VNITEFETMLGVELEFKLVFCQEVRVKRVFITNVKGTFLGMSESEEASKRR
jgi:hypothetical protein